MTAARAPLLESLPRGLHEALPPALFVALVCALGPWWSVYELDADEGFNLMKALLVADGHSLYRSVWSDQPPLLTWLLAGLFAMTGPSVAGARALVLGFAALALWSLFRLVRRQEGNESAWLAVAVLGGSALFQRLGVSVMVGLPALALALAALDQAAGGRRQVWVSGALMALSLNAKLFTATAIPAVLLAVALASSEGGRRRIAARCAEWLAAFAAVSAAVLAIARPDLMAQLVAPHTAPGLEGSFRYEVGWNRLAALLVQEPAVLLLAAAGLVLAPPWREARRWVPLLWLAVAAAAFWRHAPVWYHHALLFTLPLAWVAGPLGRAVAGPSRPRRVLALAALLLAAPLAIQAGERAWHDFRAPVAAEDTAALEEIGRFGAGARWIVTDRPMDAVRAGILVPPPLAVMSLKREKAGHLPPAAMTAALEQYAPALVSSRRLRLPREVRRVLDESYDVVVDRDDHTLYRRKPGAPGPQAPGR